ncbi:hypothetical protein GQ42DRAFT_163051 [Ramicandelaber brevisporus]|nr:hypothetical protein GQ42DRAFT_163051 [Ramicandelaber brevisporus]
MSISRLPQELVELVLTYCEIPSLLALRALSRAFCDIVTTALARIVDTAGPAFPDETDSDDHHLPPTLIRALLCGKYAEHVRGLVVREKACQADDIKWYRCCSGLPDSFGEADEFMLQHRRLSLVSHPDNIVGKFGRQIDAYRPMHREVGSFITPFDIDKLPNLTKLCILNNNAFMMPGFLSPTVLARLTWIEIEVDGEVGRLRKSSLDAIAAHCKQLTHLRIVSAIPNVPNDYWLKFVRCLRPNTFKMLDIIVYPHVSTDVWEAIIETQGSSLQAVILFKTERVLGYLADMPALPNVKHLLTMPLSDKLDQYQPLLTERLPNLRHIHVTTGSIHEPVALSRLPSVQSAVQRGRYTTYDYNNMCDHACFQLNGCSLSTIHIVCWTSGVSVGFSDILSCPSLRVLSVTESLNTEYTEHDDPNEYIVVDIEQVSDETRKKSNLRVLRLLFWTTAIKVEVARAVLSALPRLGSLQLAKVYTPNTTIDLLRSEFGYNRAGLEPMDFGEHDPKDGVVGMTTRDDRYSDMGYPNWNNHDDNPVVDWTYEPCPPWCDACGPFYGYDASNCW